MKLDELEARLEDYGFTCISYGFEVKEVYDWYKYWTSYKILPFGNSYMDQPFWLWGDFNTFSLIEQWVSLDIKTRDEADTIAGNNPDL